MKHARNPLGRHAEELSVRGRLVSAGSRRRVRYRCVVERVDAPEGAVQNTLLSQIPAETTEWLLGDDNPAVAVLTRRLLLEAADDAAVEDLWARRNEYAPVAQILSMQNADGSWAPPARDYQKYGGSLWQIHFLGELWANPDDECVRRGVDYAFRRQLADGSWSCSNMQPSRSITCLTANVGRALARLGHERDERVVGALRYCVGLFDEIGSINCRPARDFQLNGYCHMLTSKMLLFLAEIPRDAWPSEAEKWRDRCVRQLRDKSVCTCLPTEAAAFSKLMQSASPRERPHVRSTFLAEHPVLHYEDKPGWLRLGFPLSYNSDTLEALFALASSGEPFRKEYEAALAVVRDADDEHMRWPLRNSFNGKMLADVEAKGKPSKWLTLRALLVLKHFSD